MSDTNSSVIPNSSKSVDDELDDLKARILHDAHVTIGYKTPLPNGEYAASAPPLPQKIIQMPLDDLMGLITQLFAKQLEEAEIRARLEEVTYWHKRTIREAPYPSQIARTLHEQEDRIAALTQDTKGGTDERN